MLYLVGGSPRVGKSTIARKFLSETGIPYFGLDYLKMGLARGLPEYGIDPNNDDRITAQQLWPVVKGMAMTYVENEEDCLLEGVYLLPEYTAELRQNLSGHVRVCFVGFTQVDTMKKVRQLRHFGEMTGDLDWASDDDEQAIENVEFLKTFSAYVKEECRQYDLRYFENSTDHWQTIDAAVRFLRE